MSNSEREGRTNIAGAASPESKSKLASNGNGSRSDLNGQSACDG